MDNKPDFHGAAIIDSQGREIAITEAMIQEACQRLAQELPRCHYSDLVNPVQRKAG